MTTEEIKKIFCEYILREAHEGGYRFVLYAKQGDTPYFEVLDIHDTVIARYPLDSLGVTIDQLKESFEMIREKDFSGQFNLMNRFGHWNVLGIEGWESDHLDYTFHDDNYCHC